MLEMVMGKETSHWWWFDSHHATQHSPWLQSTLGELDKKTKAMLKLIEEDADSFAQRAEMYYKKRPELISMVEDFYRAHRSLAERYDQLKSDSGNRLLTSLGSPFSTKSQLEKLMSVDQNYYSHSETYDHEDSAESEVDDPEHDDEMMLVDKEEPEHDDEILVDEEEPEVDNEILVDEEIEGIEEPEQEEETHVDEERGEVEVSSAVCDDEVMKLREEIETLKEENRIYENQLLQKDDEHKEVIRQLREEIERLKEEETQVDEEIGEVEVSSAVCDDEMMKLREDIERLKEENRIHENQLLQKDEEKREVIRQLREEIERLKEEETQVDEEVGEVEVSSSVCDDEVTKLRGEIERLKEENRIHENQLLQKDEDKREVIRQLSLAVEMLKLENVNLRKCVARGPTPNRSHFAFEKLRGVFSGKLFNGSRKSQGSMVAL